MLFEFSPWINFTLRFWFKKIVASSLTFDFSFIAMLNSSLNLKACGVCVNREFFLRKLKTWFLTLYFIESFEVTTGTTALFFLKFFAIFLSKSIEKFGLAASWIKTFFGLYFLRYLRAFKDESDLSLPPLIILINLEFFLFLNRFKLFVTIIICLKSFEFKAFSIEWSIISLFL